MRARTKHVLAWAWKAVLVQAIIVLGVLNESCFPACAADQDSAALELMQAGADRQNEDWARFQKMTGVGHLDWVDYDGTRHWACDMEFQVDGRDRMWMLLETTVADGGTLQLRDKIELVGDGTTLAGVIFSKQFRPNGCKTLVYEDDLHGLLRIGGILRFDPRTMVIPYALSNDARANYEQLNVDVQLDPDIPNAVIVQGLNHCFTRYEFSEEWDFRLIRLSVYCKPTELAQIIQEYVYRHGDNGMEPSEFILKTLHHPDPVAHNTFRIYFDSLIPEISRETFNLASLSPCAGSRVLDYRKNADIPVRSMAEASVSAMPDATIDEQVEVLPSSVSGKPFFVVANGV